VAAAPGYALSDSSASTASQTSFTCRTTYYTKGVPIRLHKGSALGCLPERTLQPPAIRSRSSAAPATNARHSASLRPPPIPRTPQASLSALALPCGQRGSKWNRQRGPGAYTRRSTGPKWRCARHAPDDPDRPHSVLDESACVAITCFNFAERASLPAGGRMCGMRRKAQQIG